MLGMNYAPADDPMALCEQPDRARISVYARGRDYHDLVKGALKRLAGWLVHQSGADVKVFVDTAPVMEKALAMQDWPQEFKDFILFRLQTPAGRIQNRP